MEYISCIKDECGDTVALCKDMSQKIINEILENSPELYLSYEVYEDYKTYVEEY